MIGLLMKLGLGERAAKGLAILLVVVAVLGALWWLRHDAYGDGEQHERAAWELKAAQQKAEAERLQRIADQRRAEAEAADRDRIQRNRTEVDNATRNIPDQATSPRQHARACLELRRQGQNPPACQPQPAGQPAHAPR